jgi:hypothetical protein
MTVTIGRRELLAALGGAAAAWPLAERAQRAGKLPTIGFLGATTPALQSQLTVAFLERLRELVVFSWSSAASVLTMAATWASAPIVPVAIVDARQASISPHGVGIIANGSWCIICSSVKRRGSWVML